MHTLETLGLTEERLGQVVRQAWEDHARQHPDPPARWFTTWEDLDEWTRSGDRRIGREIAMLVVQRAAWMQRQVWIQQHAHTLGLPVSGVNGAGSRTAMQCSDEFRLLTAEIASEHCLSWPDAQRVARELWHDLEHDETAPVPAPVTDWRFIAYVFALLCIISLAVNAAFVWLLAFA